MIVRNTAWAAVVVLAAGALLGGCGGTAQGPGVAQGTGSPSASGDSSGKVNPAKQALAYSACMRKHGLSNFPDPQINGGRVQLKIKKGSGMNPDSPQFKAAAKACQSLQGGGQGGGHVDTAKIEPWANCMRAHGLTNFPDPKVQGNALQLDLTGTGIAPQGRPFQKAQQACRSKAPGGGMLVKAGQPK